MLERIVFGGISFKFSTHKAAKYLKFYFALITIHVLVVYYLKGVLGVAVNEPIYILIKMWKELALFSFLLIALMIWLISNHRLSILTIDLLIIVFISFGLIYVIVAPSIGVAIWSFRSLFEIFAFYYLGRAFYLDFNNVKRLISFLVLFGCIAAIFGVYQVNFLGADFYKEFYAMDEISVANTSYGYSGLRASSTFITPHEFGLYMVFCFLFNSYLFKVNYYPRRIFLLVSSVLFTGLIFSLSRSSIVVLFLCGGIFWVNNFKRLLVFVVFSVVGAMVFFAMGAVDNFISVIEGSDPSSSGRFHVLNEFLIHLKEYPFGSGLGTVGVVVRRFFPSAPQFEGEIFNLIAMTSVFGGVLYLSIILVVILKLIRKLVSKSTIDQPYYMLLLTIIIALVLRDLILPRDFTNYSLGWFLIGSTISLMRYKEN